MGQRTSSLPCGASPAGHARVTAVASVAHAASPSAPGRYYSQERSHAPACITYQSVHAPITAAAVLHLAPPSCTYYYHPFSALKRTSHKRPAAPQHSSPDAVVLQLLRYRAAEQLDGIAHCQGGAAAAGQSGDA